MRNQRNASRVVCRKRERVQALRGKKHLIAKSNMTVSRLNVLNKNNFLMP